MKFVTVCVLVLSVFALTSCGSLSQSETDKVEQRLNRFNNEPTK